MEKQTHTDFRVSKIKKNLFLAISFFTIFITFQLFPNGVYGQDLYVGAATVDITPKLPVAVDGQMIVRIAKVAETPLTANVIVLESKGANTTVLVSCDMVTIPTELKEMIQMEVKKSLPELDTKKIIINATHTHTGAVVRDNRYNIPEGVTQVKDYLKFVSDQVAKTIFSAYNMRERGSVSWGISHAKVAYNRRAVYEDGSAKMYGSTHEANFIKVEGYEDQAIQSLFFWNQKGEFVATCINVPSPAQIVENRSTVNADYWHPVREGLKEKYGQRLVVAGWIGAAGDQTPRPRYDEFAEWRMIALRNEKKSPDFAEHTGEVNFRNEYHLNEIAGRIIRAVDETYATVNIDKHEAPVLKHEVNNIELPMRLVTETEYNHALKMRAEDMKDAESAQIFSRRIVWYSKVVDRYEIQKSNPQPMYPVELHALRIGDVVICTNPFELFTEYGIQMKARSNAMQTFVLQLVGPGNYLPTKEAVRGGHYSAIVESNEVGPEGGQLLVNWSVAMINKLWPE
ncbi:hypothetical protein [uncultured Cyclobacterium sp.]|uniref:hypothetical protein n=1 Tax=uncultured Cyclobacterium sp. TaxID=453820 RepID=UPI0030EE33AF|tara:strand:- start:24496 stop:26034 length:1539 start_codon:yes stop_codon:yes gene_type:complete